jgi:hypothetical protein
VVLKRVPENDREHSISEHISHRPSLSFCRPSAFVILGDQVHIPSLKLFLRRTAPTQTDLTSSSFDFHIALIAAQAKEALAVSGSSDEIEQLRAEHTAPTKAIETARRVAVSRQKKN